ncbi:WbqC family protein [Herminiimonas sp. NPDC097707]|uniref:WbqC family protein n=1 Tax=Herminiimonas sp. NPDC097707 TaxID=3364007 RepID=UPI00383BA992
MSQPMYFPWVGILEQIGLCDTFVYYDDVQFARGFFNRVQIKTPHGIRWLTVPLLDWRRGQLINEVRIDNSTDWKRSHRDQLKQAYAEAPFKDYMLNLVDEVFSSDYDIIGDLAQASTDVLVRSFPEIALNKPFLKSSNLGIDGSSSKRLIDICVTLRADCYLTGHGARNYLAHESFEEQGVDVTYIDYDLDEYPQSYGSFTPYVSALDLIAHCGQSGVAHIRGKARPWRDFLSATENTKSKT